MLPILLPHINDIRKTSIRALRTIQIPTGKPLIQPLIQTVSVLHPNATGH